MNFKHSFHISKYELDLKLRSFAASIDALFLFFLQIISKQTTKCAKLCGGVFMVRSYFFSERPFLHNFNTSNWQLTKFYDCMKKLLLFSLIWLCFSSVQAQTKVEGVVTDGQSGEALIGVSVLVKGTNAGAVTDVNGKFTFEVKDPNKTVLVFNYTGYAAQTIALNGQKNLEVKMGEDLNALDQVVVVGYGTQRKSDLTGAVGTIKAKDIERIPTSSVDQALQGKIAGVYVSPVSGEPGKGAIIRIRGTGTLNNANPLYVVDGMLLDDIAFLNPQDVASIEVLKDASSTAIYGNRGANGVIIITTKKGSDGKKAIISFDSYYGTQQIARKLQLANASEFAQMYNELTKSTYYKNPAALGAGTDWQDEIYKPAPIGNVQLSVAGRVKRLTYSVSGNYFNQQGILDKTGFERGTGRFNGEYAVTSYLKIGANIAYSGELNKTVLGGVSGAAYRMPPVFGPRDSTGKFTDPTFFGLAISNPAADLYYKSDWRARVNRVVSTVYADVKLPFNLTFRSNFGIDRRRQKVTFIEPVYKVSASQLNNLNRNSISTEGKNTWLLENTLTYDKSFSFMHLNVLGGQTVQQYKDDFRNEVNDTLQPNGEGNSDWAMLSYLFRTNISFFDRYLITFSARADGSSRFSKSNRWGYFPSVAFGWNVTQEPWMQGQKVFDRLKMRASWGIVGNDKTQTYPSLGFIQDQLYAVFGPDQQIYSGATLIKYANPSVRWESAKQTDVGLEFALFKGRLSSEIDWYNRYTYDILAELPIPAYVGSLGAPVVNSAAVRNRGWDFTVNWREKRGKFGYNLGIIYSTVQNEVEKLNQGRSEIFAAQLPSGDFATRTVVGQSIGAFYGYKVAGIFQNQQELNTLPKIGTEKPGDLRFEDIDGDGVITEKDRTSLGSPIPKMTYGFSGGIEFWGFDASADFFGVKGNRVLNAKVTPRYGVYNWEKSYYDNRWTSETSIGATAPRVTSGGHNYRMSSFLIKDGSFLRLRSVVLGYNLPQSMLERLKITRLRFYVSGTNLWTKQSYSGYSTEFPNTSVFEAGIDNLNYPMSKTMLFGMNLTF